MKLTISSSGIVDYRRPGQGAKDLAAAGFTRIAMASPVDIVRAVSGKDSVEYRALSAEIFGQTVRSLSPKKPSTAPGGAPVITTLFAPDIAWRGAGSVREFDPKAAYACWADEAKKTLFLAASCGIESVMIRPLSAGLSLSEAETFYGDFLREVKKTAGLELVYGKGFPKKILLTNGLSFVNGHYTRGAFSDGRRAAALLDELNEGRPAASSGAAVEEGPVFAFCLDTAAASLTGQDMHSLITGVGERLESVLLAATGDRDLLHLLPFVSGISTDWTGLIRGLRAVDFDGDLILDLGDSAGACSPLLKPSFLAFAKDVGDFFAWQICMEAELARHKNIVLFGAGNMCRNFMVSYGDRCRPLFTCDNNSSLWGTTFCGLEVKDPQVLRDLPAGTAVFICNVYYREIREQLEKLGVKEIYDFNDEYLPVFPEDRLERGLIR